MTRRRLGGFIRAQRQMSNLSLRPLSALAAVYVDPAGVSQGSIVAAIHA